MKKTQNLSYYLEKLHHISTLIISKIMWQLFPSSIGIYTIV